MTQVLEFLATGFEEVEAMIPVDVLRRGGVNIKTVSMTGSELVESSHHVTIKADLKFEDIKDFDEVEMLLLPGGMPGAKNLNEIKELHDLLNRFAQEGKHLGAICAGPMVLGTIGLLKGKKATCYPGFETHLKGAEYTHNLVTVDGNIVTGGGPAAAFPYAFKVLSLFVPEEKVEQLKEEMLYKKLMDSRESQQSV